MIKKDIETREEIKFLVEKFYDKVRQDSILKPFFENVKDWSSHIEKLTAFWQSSIFLNTKYRGDPLEAHIKVDEDHGHTLEQKHFGRWMNLWYETIDELYSGERSNIAKNRARKMSTFLFLKIFEARHNSNKI
jgi:hemoglobin